MNKPTHPKGNENRDAIASLGGYVYQIYQAAIAWLELDTNEFLFLEVSEDYAISAKLALQGVQVKRTDHHVTINSDDIIASINSFVELKFKQPQLDVSLRHLTTSLIGKERSPADRIGDVPTLVAWRNLAKIGDLAPLRTILMKSKLSLKTKEFVQGLDDVELRENFLKKIHFDCGALDFKYLKHQLIGLVIKNLQQRAGTASQAEGCVNNLLMFLLNKSIEKEERFVSRANLEDVLEAATHISMNRSQFDAHNALITQALASSVPKTTDLISSRLALPQAIDEVPLPSAIAQRMDQVRNIVSSLERDGISWVLGGAGVGKTVAAKLAARNIGGNWASLNLRSLSSEQVSWILKEVQQAITKGRSVQGLLIDDFECPTTPYVVENFLSLLSVCRRRDLLLIITAPRPAPTDILFSSGLTASIELKLAEFSESDIAQILRSLGINDNKWAKYIYFISGGGHPQLAIAAIQSMQRSGWDVKEFISFDSLLTGNSEIEQVRTETRQRLLTDLPEGSRRLIERLSLTTGGFRRSLVLDVARIIPAVSDGGVLFDGLIGSWIDQQEKDRFYLSPLLSNYASATLTEAEKKSINFEIANSLIKTKTLDPITANAALLAAWIGQNEGVLCNLCYTIISSEYTDLKMIAPHLRMLRLMRTDRYAYDNNPAVSHLIRGSQLVLMCYEEDDPKGFDAALICFKNEAVRVQSPKIRAGMEVVIYAKILLSEPVYGALPNFIHILNDLYSLLENRDVCLPNEFCDENIKLGKSDLTIGFMFLNQVRLISKIEEVLVLLKELDSLDVKFRDKIFSVFDTEDIPIDIDMLISSSWLAEHRANTIDANLHAPAYAQMEQLANKWGLKNFAVACRKYQAIILDEYGNNKEAALERLEDGLKVYGIMNYELIRAKAKLLYRANNHQASLELSSKLIEEEAPLSETEKAFLGREAAISAEEQVNYTTARRYYLFGANAAEHSSLPDMIPMYIGLLADAAIASWRAGDRATCLRDFARVLEKLAFLDANSSLRAAHCHAVSRHVILWLDQEASGETRYVMDGEAAGIYPGMVSNPEPHPDIGKRFLPTLDLSWYMLAQVECSCLLDLGIARGIEAHLPKGPVREGQTLLTRTKLKTALHQLDIGTFSTALAETVAEFALVVHERGDEKSFNIENVTYGRFPDPDIETIRSLSGLAEQQILTFCALCILRGRAKVYDAFLDHALSQRGYTCSDPITMCLLGKGAPNEYFSSYASLLFGFRKEMEDKILLSPVDVFDLAFKIYQMAKLSGHILCISEQLINWLRERWAIVWEKQRFLLRQPSLYEREIFTALAQNEPNNRIKVLDILIAILPTLGISNQSKVKEMLMEVLMTVRTESPTAYASCIVR